MLHPEIDTKVRTLIAHRIDVLPERIQPTHHLDRDLGLDPLDLVLIALDLEDLEGLEFPIARLQDIHTVADFISLARDWSDEGPPSKRLAS